MKKTYYIGYYYIIKAGSTIDHQIEIVGQSKKVAEAYLKHIKTLPEFQNNNRHDAYIEWYTGDFVPSKGWKLVDEIRLHRL